MSSQQASQSRRVFSTMLLASKTPESLVELVQQDGQGAAMRSQRMTQPGRVALKDSKSFGQAQLALRLERDARQQPMEEQQAQQPGIQLTQETFWSALPDALKQSLGFPELEEQFNLPTYSVHQGNVLGVKPLLGDIADKQAPIQQGQAALRGLLTMFGGGPAGLAP